MFPLALALMALAVAAILWFLFNFRFLLYPLIPNLNPMNNAKHVNFNGSTLFISDLHLKADQAFPYSAAIRQVLQEQQVSNLVVVGDLFDSPEDGRTITGNREVSPVADILGVRGLTVKSFFIQGSPAHDPSPQENTALNLSPLLELGRCAILDFDRVTVVAYHGHDLSSKGMIGHGWDRFISNLSLERAWKKLAGVPASNWVIFGHTHIPGIDEKHRVANCGGWQRIPILVHPARTGLLLSPEDGSLEIVHFAR